MAELSELTRLLESEAELSRTERLIIAGVLRHAGQLNAARRAASRLPRTKRAATCPGCGHRQSKKTHAPDCPQRRRRKRGGKPALSV